MNASDLWPAIARIDAAYSLQLTQALIHFLWQGCAIAAVYAAAMFALRRSSAARHMAGAAALLLMAACLPVTLCLLPSPQPNETKLAQADEGHSDALLPLGASKEELAAEDDFLGTRSEMGATAGLSSSARHISREGTAGQASSGTPAILLRLSPYASAFYLCGVVLMLVRVSFGVLDVGRLRRICTPVADDAILQLIRDCARRMVLRAVPVAAYCQRISTPMAVGILRPMILLPTALASGLTPTQLQAILLHEMAHLRRYDLIVNILQRLVEAMLFFHPAVWWISRRVSIERENACDDLATLAGEDRLHYADALLRAAELCAAAQSIDARRAAALAATGENASQFGDRLRRLLGQNDRPKFRLTVAGAAASVLLVVALLLMPTILRGAGGACDKAADEQPVSMSANEFMQLTPTEQRDLLVSVFQHRLDQADNIYYKTEQLHEARKYNNGAPGELLDRYYISRSVYRHWRLNDSCRLDIDAYNTPEDAKTNCKLSFGVNGEEGLARVVTIRDQGEYRPSGAVSYPQNPIYGDKYIDWLDRKFPQRKELGPSISEPLFPYLVRHKDEFKIKQAGELIRLSVPWNPTMIAESPAGRQVLTLDPRKGFLPVRCDSYWESELYKGKQTKYFEEEERLDDEWDKGLRKDWLRKSFEVEESRLVGEVWMPTKICMKKRLSLAPGQISVCKIKVVQMEHGKVKPADLMVPFSEGMPIIDSVKGVKYTADAEGKPAGPVENAPRYKKTPPDWWIKRYGKVNPGAGGYSLASRISSAEEFMRLTPTEQRDLLVRVFQHRLKQADNLYYKTEQLFEVRKNNNGSPGEPIDGKPDSRWEYRHWRLNDSCRTDTAGFQKPDDAKPNYRSSYGVNADEGLARYTTLQREDEKHPPTGQVLYPQNTDNGNLYIYWLNRKFPQPKEFASSTGEPLFQNILRHKDEFKIEPADELIRLSVPWRPWWADKPSGTQVCLLDPQKGYLPVKCETQWDTKADDGKPIRRQGSYTVKECRLVGDVWMPVKITEQHFFSLLPDTIAVCDINVLNMEAGKVKPDDLMVPFSEGMQIRDTVEGISYTSDAQGKPIGRYIAYRKMNPPDWWIKRYGKVKHGVGGYSLASRLSPKDQNALDAANDQMERDKLERRKTLESLSKKLKSLPPEAVNKRIDAAMEILRTGHFDLSGTIWVGAIRELILLGKPAVPRLIEELDRCKEGKTMQALGFALRGIGDPRAIPVLIRALPRSFEFYSASSHTIKDDPELVQFMLKLNFRNIGGGRQFVLRTPRSELTAAIEKLTGQTFDGQEWNRVYVKGGTQQRRVIQTQILTFARLRADWWKDNWQKHLDDESKAQLDLIEKSLQKYADSIPKASGKLTRHEFPRGPNVVMYTGIYGEYRSFIRSPSTGFLDIDSGRRPVPPKTLLEESADGVPSKNLIAWAEREGVDLIVVERKPSDGKKPYTAFMPLGMKVWRIDDNRYKGIHVELCACGKFDLPEPWTGLIAQTDPKTGAFDERQPAAYLFITAEGICGVIHLDGEIFLSYFHEGIKNIDAVKETSDTTDPQEKHVGGFEFDPHSRRNIHSDINKAIRNGASWASELAVSKALKWIAQHQLEDGGWSFDLEKCPGCEGKCRNSGKCAEARIAATGLALLPFLGAGDTHKNEGPYQSAIQDGLNFLVNNMQESSHGGKLSEPGGTMYSHGIATIAICEAYGMTRDSNLLSPARETLSFICYAQDPVGGGWRYQPRQKGDTSVLGWQLTALRSGFTAGFEIPPLVVERTGEFLDSVQSNDGATYGYTTLGQGEATTAIGLLCRMYLGWQHDNPALERGVRMLSKRGPSPSNMYYNYYATQVMRYWEGEPWENWNRQMRDQLVDSQAKQGHEEGSWFTGSGDLGASTGGRLYFTAMATMILEVYYRNMPIYKSESINREFPD